MDIVNREEFEAVRDMAVAARNANDALEKRIAELEARIAAPEAKS
jgi:BMFP domain-containing protein YqiC